MNFALYAFSHSTFAFIDLVELSHDFARFISFDNSPWNVAKCILYLSEG